MSDRRLVDQSINQMAGNAEQLAAVQEGGHCVVLAGPGSGKTKTLTTAMARTLLEDVTEPRGVACITYNNECAVELEERLQRLGVEPSDRVFIGTVHSFALAEVIGPYARCALPEFPAEFRVATREEQRAAVEVAYEETLNEGEDPHRRWQFATEKRKRDVDRSLPDWHGRNPELATFVEAYEAILHRQGLIDFDDMPLIAFRMIRDNQWIRDALRARFPVLFVDEYQDLGHALHALVLLLCFEGGLRLFAVGDVDQSIYAFAGANPQLLAGLAARPDVETIQLRFNYRSGSKIIGASMAALGEERGYVTPEGAGEGAVLFRSVDGDLDVQARYVAEVLIPEIVEHGIALDQVGVLYRNAQQGNAVAAAAMAAAIPIVRSDNQALVRRSSRLSRFLEACAKWVAGGWRGSDPPFHRLAREAAALVYGPGSSDDERRVLGAELIRFLSASVVQHGTAHAWLQELRRELIAPWRARARVADGEWEVIDEMIQRTAPGSTEDGLSLANFGGHVVGTGRLNLSTLHSAKGREFDVAILFAMNDDIIPNWQDNKRPASLPEVRRLFYVGVTRARRELYLVFRKGHHSPWVNELHIRVNAT